MRKLNAKIGDRFSKLEDSRTVWIVQRLVYPLGLPPNLELQAEGHHDRKVIISSSIVVDRSFFRRVENI